MPGRYAFLDFMADCVIHVDQRVTAQITTRRLRVIKYRGSGYGRNEYPFIINEDGINIVPITSNVLQHRAPGPRVSSGASWLDDVLGGGYKRGTSILIAGTAGAGKTTMACLFAEAACLRGEQVLYINFEESAESMASNMLSAGVALQPLLKAGTLAIQSYLPEAMGVEEHLFYSLKDVDRLKPHHVVVDAISACKRMGSDQAAFEYLMRVLNVCKERGITCIYINQTAGLDVAAEISGIGVSSLVDTIVLLRHLPNGRSMERQLTVMKARGSKHSEQFHAFQHHRSRDRPGDELAGSMTKARTRETHVFRLFVAGNESNSLQASENLARLCEEHIKGRYTIDTVDVLKDAASAYKNHVLVTPTLILVKPGPMVTVFGNLNDTRQVLAALRMKCPR